MAIGAVLAALPGTAASAAPPESMPLGENVVVRTDFVGVVNDGDTDLTGGENIITWTGDPRTGTTEVLWAAREPTNLRDGDGRAATARYIGHLSEAQLEDVRERLTASTRPKAPWQVGIMICSLNVANPIVEFLPNFTRARGSVGQTCSSFLTQRVTERLYVAPPLTPLLQASADSGNRNTVFVNAVGLRTCNSTLATAWANWGHGEATNLSGVFFNGPTEQTPYRSLGCRH